MKGLTYLLLSHLIILITILVINPDTVNAQWHKNIINPSAPCPPCPYIPIAADIEDDGDMDILVGQIIDFDNITGKLVWYENPNWTKHELQDAVGIAKSSDLNNDNKSDIIATNFSNNEVVWYEAPTWEKHIIGTNFQGALGLEIVDFDKDNDIDIIATSYSTSKIIWYEAPNWTAHTISENLENVVLIKTADIDLDNDIDVIVPSASNGLIWLEAPSWNIHSIDNQIISDFNQLDVGDIDNDGDIDVVFGATGNNQIILYKNPTWSKQIFELDDAWGTLMIDMDNDADLDIVATGQGDSTVAWYESPDFEKHVIDNSFYSASGVCVANFDGDDQYDVVVCGLFSCQIALYTTHETSIPFNQFNTKIPTNYNLEQNYPNPFNPITTIQYSLPKSEYVTIKIYNLAGQEIETLINRYQTTGVHQVHWTTKSLSSGIYFYRLQTDNFSETKKLLLQK